MGKKKNYKQNNNGQIISINQEQLKDHPNKYIGIFEVATKENKDINTMISAVAMINADLMHIACQDVIPQEQKDQVIEAFEHIVKRMLTSEYNERKIKENWFGDHPLLFRMGSTFAYEKDIERVKFEYTLLSEEHKKLYIKIFNYVWNKRDNRYIITDSTNIAIPKAIYREQLEEYKHTLKDAIITFLQNEESGVFILRISKTGGDIISALRNLGGNISIVPSKELEWSYSHDAETGKFIGNPDNEKYVDFDIKL